ncbi:hypothetical protein ACFPRL_31795 [Pseudoclavibacter helvolus]
MQRVQSATRHLVNRRTQHPRCTTAVERSRQRQQLVLSEHHRRRTLRHLHQRITHADTPNTGHPLRSFNADARANDAFAAATSFAAIGTHPSGNTSSTRRTSCARNQSPDSGVTNAHTTSAFLKP